MVVIPHMVAALLTAEAPPTVERHLTVVVLHTVEMLGNLPVVMVAKQKVLTGVQHQVLVIGMHQLLLHLKRRMTTTFQNKFSHPCFNSPSYYCVYFFYFFLYIDVFLVK